MKFIVVIVALLFSLNHLFGQEKTWLDQKWKKTTKEKASYYRPQPKKFKKGFWIVDYYTNGSLKREGFAYYQDNKIIFNGLITEYHKNGRPSLKANYKKGLLHGLHREYFETGELKKQYRYKKGKQDGVWKEFYKTGKIKTKGKYRNGEKVGVWKTFYKNVYSDILDY